MQIHWHEGLFLLPHHLQRLQRNFLEQAGAERRLGWAYPYGVVESRISRNDLENLRLRFERLRAIMPSGTEVNFPDGAELPSREIKEALQEKGVLTVSLGVPLWSAARTNSVATGEPFDPRAKILYRVVESEWADENTGGNPKPLLERRINACLLLDGEDRSDMETIPLLRVSRSAGEDIGLPRHEPGFVGPCLLLNASAALSELVRDLVGQIQSGRQELLLLITRGGFSMDALRGLQLEQILRLQALTRASSRLEALLRVPAITPFEIYLELLDVVSSLAALHPDRDLADCPAYDHDNPYPCFQEMARRIRLFLRGGVKPNFLKVPFELKDGVLTATLAENHFTEPNDYFLGIRTKQDPLTLARFVENEDRFKVMPGSMINRAIRGVLLKEERFPPLELPAQSGLYYFRMLRGDRPETWKQIQNEKVMIVRWSEQESADYQATLYMPLPFTP